MDQAPLVVIRLSGGDYDLARKDDLCKELEPAEKTSEATIDFSDVKFIDSTAINCLLRLKKRMLEHSGSAVVRLIGVSARLERLFDITGLSKVFEIVPVS